MTQLRPWPVSSSIAIAAACFAVCAARAEGPTVSVTGVPADQDSTISIRKGDKSRSLEPDFEINSGTEEISGDPVAGKQESYLSWKKACADWKKDMREMNGAALVSLSCGTPRADRDSSSRVTQTSTGTYKLKVRIRDQH
jgi:hypothetical protein